MRVRVKGRSCHHLSAQLELGAVCIVRRALAPLLVAAVRTYGFRIDPAVAAVAPAATAVAVASRVEEEVVEVLSVVGFVFEQIEPPAEMAVGAEGEEHEGVDDGECVA